MTGPNKKLISAVEAYFTDMGRVHASGGGTRERSSHRLLHSCAGSDPSRRRASRLPGRVPVA